MGRLDHVQRSSKALLADARIDGVKNHYVLADYYCPNGTGAWARKEYGDRVSVLEFGAEAPIPDGQVPIFNKPIALNAGATRAIELGAEWLVFLDADTVVNPGLTDFLFHYASLDRFMIFEPSLLWRDLTGFLVVHKRHFVKVNGYDKAFVGWGAEDLEMRIKLYMRGAAPLNQPKSILSRPDLHSLFWTEIPAILASSISHDDTRRVAHYEAKDKDLSHGLNLNLLCSNIYNWLGLHPVDLHETPLGPYMRRLLGMELLLNPKALE